MLELLLKNAVKLKAEQNLSAEKSEGGSRRERF